VLDGKALCLAAALAAGAADQGGAVVQWRFRDRSVRIAVRLGIQWGQRVTIELDGRPEQAKGNALLVEFGPGRVDFSGVTELVVPSPEMYHLKGSYKSDVASVRGLQWRIVCAGGTNPIGESRPVTGSDPTWREFRRIPNRFHKTSSRQHGSLLISPLRL